MKITALLSILGLVLAAQPSIAHAGSESSDLAEIRAELASMRAELDALKHSPAQAPATPPNFRRWKAQRAAAANVRVPMGQQVALAASVLRGPSMLAFAPSILPAWVSNSYAASGASGNVDNIVPADGTVNVTGAVASSNATGLTISGTASTLGSSPSGVAVGLSRGGGGELILWSNAGATAATITTTTFNTVGALQSTGAVASGGTVNGIETDYGTAADVATDTNPVSITGISLAIDANDVYEIECQGTVFTAVAGSGPQPGLDLPASATQVATCDIATTATTYGSFSFTADDGNCANTTGGLVSPGGSFFLRSVVTNSTNAGNVVLRMRSEDTNDVTVQKGVKCTSKKITDN